MPFTGPNGRGPFDSHSDCAAAMADEEGITDEDALCAIWERQAEGKAETKGRFDELSRKRLLHAAVDHPSLVDGIEQKAEADDDHVFGPATNGVSYRLEADEVYCEEAGEVFDQFDEADADDVGRRQCPHCGDQLQDYDKHHDSASAMSPRQKSTAATGFDVIDGPDLLAQKADSFDPENPPEEYEAAIEADDFLIYGKASIEQHDIEDQRISVKALEKALDRFFDSEDAPGIISRGHADVPVGVPVREHTLDSDTTLVIDGETYEFEAGEAIRTEVKDADGDQLPELWLASRLANDSDIARESRYKALTGDLNGYSVTVKPHSGARMETDEGEDILSVDLHAVTLGTDEQIRNKGSEFDVAEFKAILDGHGSERSAQAADDAVDQLAEDLGQELRRILS